MRDIPDQLHIIPLINPVVEANGFAPLSQYVETVWLPVLDPTTTLLYRRLGTWVIQEPDGLDVDPIDLAVSFGLSENFTHGSALRRSIGRLVTFDVARWFDDTLAVRRAVRPLTDEHALNLSYSAYMAHKAMAGARVLGT